MKTRRISSSWLHVHQPLPLSHGDIPYNQCAQRSDLPAEDLLIDCVTFNN